MLSQDFITQLVHKYDLSQEIIESLTREMIKTRGESVRFEIDAIGGKGMWKRNQLASVGNGFNEALNEFVTDLCTEISEEIQATEDLEGENRAVDDDPTTIIKTPKKPEGLDDTIGIMPIALKPNVWWPEDYGDMPDLTGNVSGLRYAYFADLDRLVLRQNLRNRIFGTENYHVYGMSPGTEPGFFNLLVQTRQGEIILSKLREVAK